VDKRESSLRSDSVEESHPDMNEIRRALISVFDKRGVVEFARSLVAVGIEILSTGNTARLLEEEGIVVRRVSEVTGFPEILEGRVKTLHPRIHGGILAIRNNDVHREQLKEHEIQPIDLVAANLYPFSETIRKSGVTFPEVIENIDIGGPCMLRAAAKNFQDVVVVTNPDEYPRIVEEITGSEPLSLWRRFELAREAFQHTARYDQEIATYLSGVTTSPDGFQLPRRSG